MTDHTAYDRLMAEAIPTGKFGGPYTPTPVARLPEHLEPTSTEDAARHAAELAAEAATFDVGRHARHLTAVPNHTDTAA